MPPRSTAAGPTSNPVCSSFTAFFEVVEDLKIETVSGQRIVRTEALRAWLRKTPTSGKLTNFQQMLWDVFPRNHYGPDHDLLRPDGDKRMDIVFSILVTIDRALFVDIFRSHGYYDRKLPLQEAELCDSQFLKVLGLNAEEGKRMARDFVKWQWIFKPGKFDISHIVYKKGKILPIHKKKLLGEQKGGTALLYRIEVLEEYLAPTLREEIQGSCYDDVDNDDYGPRYQLVMKTFRPGMERYFEKEKEVLRSLHGDSKRRGFVRYLGSSEHIHCFESRDHPEYEEGTARSILFEHGDFDLEEYFRRCPPPETKGEIRSFWENLLHVAHALSTLHEQGEESKGWHADIKPDNILSVNNEFVLADLGFAGILRAEYAHEAQVGTGTTTYGPPLLESPDMSPEKLAQSIDIWSLGTVMSIAATWIVCGQKGIDEYGNLREKAVQDLLSQNMGHKGLTKGDLFHNGRDILPDIRQWHEYLKQIIRQSDTITAQILDLVERHMLRGVPRDRLTADGVCKEYERILKHDEHEARQLGAQDLPANIREAKQRALEDLQKTLNKNRTEQLIRREGHQTAVDAIRDTKINNHRFEQARSTLFVTAMNEAPGHLGSNLRIQVQGPRSSSDPNRSVLPGKTSFPSTQGAIPEHRSVQPSRMTQSPSPISPMATQNVFTPPQSLPKRGSTFLAIKPIQKPTEDSASIFQAWNSRRKASDQKFWLPARFQRKEKLIKDAFKNRDIVFWIDNATSMQPYWDELIFHMHELLPKIAGVDKDGIDMYLTCTPMRSITYEDITDPKVIKAALDKEWYGPQKNTYTKIASCLEESFKNNLKKWRLHTESLGEGAFARVKKGQLKSEPQPKNVTLFILTDGSWIDDGYQKKEVEEAIAKFYRDLIKEAAKKEIDLEEHRIFSIQFIQFGNHPGAWEYFARLDDDFLKERQIPDMIDHEHSCGDIYKMILGSIIPGIDERDKNSTARPSSTYYLDGNDPTSPVATNDRDFNSFGQRDESLPLIREP